MQNKNIFPGWEIMNLIGSGGFSKVYKIRKEESGRSDFFSALKIIDIPHSQEEYRAYRSDGYDDESITQIFGEQVKEIIQEFELMHQFRGVTNIVSYEDHLVVQNDNGVGWKILIRMELLKTLPDWFMSNSVSDETVKQLGLDICRALKLCEQKKIVHRDIKPQNIFVNDFGDFKLGDFGVARVMEHTTRATKTGTYPYMAPEIYSGKPYNYISDIYSLGLVLYWLLNERRLPFVPLPPTVPTLSANNEAQIRRLKGEPIPAPKYGSDELKAVVLKACAFDPKDRYASAAEFENALRSITGKGIICNPQVTPLIASVDERETVFVSSSSGIEQSGEKTVSIFVKTQIEDSEPEKNVAPIDDKMPEEDSHQEKECLEQTDAVESSEDLEKTVGLFDNAETVEPEQTQKPNSSFQTKETINTESKNSESVGTSHSTPNKEPEEKKSKKNKLWILLLVAATVAIIVILLLLKACGNDENGCTSSQHIYSADWERSATSHYRYCDCGEHKDSADHSWGKWQDTADDAQKHTCAICGYEEAEHVPDVESSEPIIEDSNEFSEESDESLNNSKESEDVSEPEAHVHAYSQKWSTNETAHWHVCDCGEHKDSADHSWSEWDVTKNATENTTGSKKRNCAVCEYEETATIPILSHTHSYSSNWTKNETNHWRVCNCGEKSQLSSHTYGTWMTTRHPTCTATGSMRRTCTVCGSEQTQTLSATGHNWLAATRTEPSTCSRCGITTGERIKPKMEWQQTIHGPDSRLSLSCDVLYPNDRMDVVVSRDDTQYFGDCTITVERGPFGGTTTVTPSSYFQFVWTNGGCRVVIIATENTPADVYHIKFENSKGYNIITFIYGYEGDAITYSCNDLYSPAAILHIDTEQRLTKGQTGVSTSRIMGTIFENSYLFGVSYDGQGVPYPDVTKAAEQFYVNRHRVVYGAQYYTIQYGAWYLAADSGGNVYFTKVFSSSCRWDLDF